MNKILKEKLNAIEGIGQKMMYLQAVNESSKEKLEAIENAGKDLDDLPDAKKALDKAVAEIRKEMEENEKEIAELKSKLPH